MSKGQWFSKTLRVMVILGLIAILGIAGCGGSDSDSPTTPTAVAKCLEVSQAVPWALGIMWPVSLKNGASGEVLKSFSIMAVAACANDSDGNEIACWQNAVWEGDQLISFDATIDGENYSYPADAC